MDFVKMQHILAVAEIGNFSRAAEKCFISQPALTRSVSKTEESLNVKLFDRTTTPVTLTAAGKKNLKKILYPGGRHEILNESALFDKVCEDVIAWINEIV